MKTSKQWRMINIPARFTPDGPDPTEMSSFMEFWVAAMARITQLRQRALVEDKRQSAKFFSAVERTDPIIRKMLGNQMPVKTALKKLKRLVPDERTLRELFDFWEKATKTSKDEIARQKEDSACKKLELAKKEKRHKARKTIHAGGERLFEDAMAGDAEAAKELVEAAIEMTGFVGFLESKHFGVLEEIAKRHSLWPVLAMDEPGWEKEGVKRIARLKLGTQHVGFKTRFRQARGADTQLPARRWAKAAVRTIEETQFRCMAKWQLSKDFGSPEELLEFCFDNGWRNSAYPDWFGEVLKLKAFSMATLPEWKRVIRKLIREHVPDFHTHPDWVMQRSTAEQNARNTTGEVQNAILDDICSALARIAPAKELPKSVC